MNFYFNYFLITLRAALNVKLTDVNFQAANLFEYVSGFNTVNWARVLPHSNVTHVAVVRPKFVGLFNLTHAKVTYLPNEKSQKVQVRFLKIDKIFSKFS